jgi:hypothetical protein
MGDFSFLSKPFRVAHENPSVKGPVARPRPWRSPLSISVRTNRSELPLSEAKGWDVKMTHARGEGPGVHVHVTATWKGDQATQAGLVVHRPIKPHAEAEVLVPAVFYGDNGSGNASTHFPRLGPLNHQNFTSPTWDFASERTALPAVFLEDGRSMPWLAVAPTGTGVGFDLSRGHEELRVHSPGVERPYAHDRMGDAPVEPLRTVAPGETLELDLWYGTSRHADASGVAKVQRALQREWNAASPRPLDEKTLGDVASAARDGLLTWHYRPEVGRDVLVEAVDFELKSFRPDMHVGWVSGTPAAFALLRHGVREKDAAAAEAGRKVLDTVASGLSPSGLFYGEWTSRGWKSGWNGDARKVQARTLAEATLFLVRALALEGVEAHPDWAKAVRSNLDVVLRSMDRSGNPGSFYDQNTGEVLDRRGTGGLLWVSALSEAARVLGDSRYQKAAVRVGESFEPALRAGRLLGAPEDIGLTPSSEDGYNALLATLALYESTHEARWLSLAKLSADWMLTFRWSYDVVFPKGSTLDQRGLQTRGADAASPSNNHLHNYGMIVSDELVRLSGYLHDPWYAQRAQDHLAAFVKAIALKDDAFGVPQKRGMMAEQLYTANWSTEGRAGELGAQSHAWVLGLLLLASEDWLHRTAA